MSTVPPDWPRGYLRFLLWRGALLWGQMGRASGRGSALSSCVAQPVSPFLSPPACLGRVTGPVFRSTFGLEVLIRAGKPWREPHAPWLSCM